MNASQSRKIEIGIHLSHPGLIVVLVVIWRLRECKESVVKERERRKREETNYNCRRCVNRMNSSFGRTTPGTVSLSSQLESFVSNYNLKSNLLG